LLDEKIRLYNHADQKLCLLMALALSFLLHIACLITLDRVSRCFSNTSVSLQIHADVQKEKISKIVQHQYNVQLPLSENYK
jgi:hypothetical protein